MGDAEEAINIYDKCVARGRTLGDVEEMTMLLPNMCVRWQDFG